MRKAATRKPNSTGCSRRSGSGTKRDGNDKKTGRIRNMDLVRKSARGKNPVMHKNNNKGAELAGEMLAGSAFSVYANNEPKPALARDLGRLSR